MNATLTTRCQELARASRTEYMQEHGGQAPKQGQLVKHELLVLGLERGLILGGPGP